jgi:hypothetical protein
LAQANTRLSPTPEERKIVANRARVGGTEIALKVAIAAEGTHEAMVGCLEPGRRTRMSADVSEVRRDTQRVSGGRHA